MCSGIITYLSIFTPGILSLDNKYFSTILPIFDNRTLGTSWAPSPTNKMIPHIVSTFKRLCNKEIGENIFQRSYMDHIIRDKDDYDTKCKYIYENPKRRYFEK